MKKTFLLVAASLVVASSAGAAVLVSDPFSYADGGLVANSSCWANHSGTASFIQVSSGQAVLTHGGGSREDVNLGFASAAGTLYYGIDFSVDDLGAPYSGSDNEYFAHFRNTSSQFFGRIDVVPPTGGGDFSVGIATSGGTADAVWATDLTYGVTYRAIVSFDQVGKVAELWIDAALETDLSILGTDDPDFPPILAAVTQVALRQSNSSEDETIRVDNVIVGTTFADVVAMTLPPVSIDDVSMAEGSTGGKTAYDFTISIPWPSATDVTVDYFTTSGTAMATAGGPNDPADYQAVSATATIPACQTSTMVTINVNADLIFKGGGGGGGDAG